MDLYHLPGFYEPFSAISHLFGAVLFVYLGALMLRRGRGDRDRMIFLGIYVFSVVTLLSVSGVYHMMVRPGTAHLVMGRIDHGAIFLLIAGSFTPAHGILFRGWKRWAPLILIWTAAIAGITLKTIFFDNLAELLGLTFYLSLGWVGILSAIELWRLYGFRFVRPLVLGGIAYTIGGAMEFLGYLVVIPGVVHPHELFHLFVLIGAFLHWIFIWQFADGTIPLLRNTVRSNQPKPSEHFGSNA